MTKQKYNTAEILSLLEKGNTFEEVALLVGCSKSTVGNVSKSAGRSYQESHGCRNSRTYRIWVQMKNRCLNSKHKDYPSYGGVGITVCKRWTDSFTAFLDDMGNAPDGYSIDRIEGSKGYEPQNCRWADSYTQNNNRNCVKQITYKGKSMNLHRWCKELNLDYSITWNHLYREGRSVEDVFG